MPSSSPYPLPTFLVVGANKAGTTSLFHYLKQHPEVYLSPLKEPHYFSNDIEPAAFSKSFAQNKLQDIGTYVEGEMPEYHAGFVREWDHYIKLFKHAGPHHKAIGELSTSYLYSRTAAANIHDKLGDIKIVMCLRDPVARAYSHYRMNLWTGNSKAATFMQALREDEQHEPKVWGNAHLYVEIGKYYEQVKRYYDHFPSENICIILSGDLKHNTKAVVRKLYQFIGVDPTFEPDTSQRFNEVFTPKYKQLTWFLNKTGIRPLIKRLSGEGVKKAIVKVMFKDKSDKGSISREESSYLHRIYDEDINKLEGLTGLDLSQWKKVEEEAA